MDNGIGKNVRYYRNRLQLTQTELAEKLGYKSFSSISKIESGDRDIPLSSVWELAKALKCSPADLFSPIPEEKEYDEYIPYLANASAETIENVRFILRMPPKKICKSEKEIV